ncbi:hypothetical protein VP1G_05269 [Cytospora mali]|uniref:Uncharacterized protein n=1 Tax=Cytospora mali TaxID=578113 RepID=A0A194V1W6_CYTMA|nr:hypothetical protein VP1G_05269 [Valsa mali var. pyri (nom. inval.)]
MNMDDSGGNPDEEMADASPQMANPAVVASPQNQGMDPTTCFGEFLFVPPKMYLILSFMSFSSIPLRWLLSTQALGLVGHQGILTLLDMVFDYKSNHATSQNQSTSSEALENTPLKTHNRRHTGLRNTAISRDIVARQQLGPLYNKHKQYEYGVIDTRATMKTGEDALNARAEELLVQKVPNPDGAKKSKFYCHSCYDSFCDWKSRHVKNCHMQNPDSDPLLICPQCFQGIRAHHHGLQELDAYMVKHKQDCDRYMSTNRYPNMN